MIRKIDIIIPRSEFPLKTVAYVAAAFTREVKDQQTLRECLTAAATEWLATDCEWAKQAREYAGDDFNIGDLDSYMNDGQFPAILERHGIKELEIEIFDVGTTNQDWTYDTALVTPNSNTE